jgi:hypothetical protein
MFGGIPLWVVHVGEVGGAAPPLKAVNVYEYGWLTKASARVQLSATTSEEIVIVKSFSTKPPAPVALRVKG